MSYSEGTPAELPAELPANTATVGPSRWSRAFAWYRTLFIMAFFAALFCIPLMGIMEGAGAVFGVAMIFVPFILLQGLLMRILTRLIPACREPRSPST